MKWTRAPAVARADPQRARCSGGPSRGLTPRRARGSRRGCTACALGAKANALFTESFLGRGMRSAWTRTVRGSLGAGVGGETQYDFGRMPRIELPGRSGSVALEDAPVGLSAEGTLRGP